MKQKKSVALGLRIEPALDKEIRKRASLEDRSVSGYVARLLRANVLGSKRSETAHHEVII
jgi:hypothetical protein